MRFSVRWAYASFRDVLKVYGRESDAMGAFKLRVSLCVEYRWLTFVKEYYKDPIYPWQGRLTSFGIVTRGITM